MISGACWLAVEGVDEPVRLSAGDSFVLPTGRPFRLASHLELSPTPASAVFPPARAEGVVTHNGGGDFFLVGSRFAVAGRHSEVLLRALPPIVHIRREADQAALRWSVERMMDELREGQPGASLVAQHLAHMMLVQADSQMSKAIGAMHAEPSRRWTVRGLAEHVGMSRTTFAQRFRETVGETPMEYLTRWRMLLAGDRLINSRGALAETAASLGYESESAFSTAFKRVMGVSPRRYGRREAALAT